MTLIVCYYLMYYFNIFCFILMACLIARWQEQHYSSIEYVEWCNYNKHLIVVCNWFARTVDRTTAACPEYGGIRYRHYLGTRPWLRDYIDFGILPVGLVMCDRPAGRIFRPLRCFTLTRKASTMSNSANIVLGLWIQRRWCYESGWQASALCGCSFNVRFRR